MKIQYGSLWRVLSFVDVPLRDSMASGSPLARGPEGVVGLPEPVAFPKVRGWDRRVLLAPGTVLLVGGVVPDADPLPGGSATFVEVLLPTRCFVNSTHFLSDSDRIERIA